MGKFILFILFIALLALAGYAGYKTLPLFQSYLQKNNPFPHVTQVFISPTPASSNSASQSATLIIEDNHQKLINDYLVSSIAIKSQTSGKVICAHKLLNSPDKQPKIIYLWAICQEYYLSGKQILTGSGISVPVSLVVSYSNSQFNITSHRYPRSGSLYASDIKEMFPSDIISKSIIPTDSAMLSAIQTEINVVKAEIF